MTESAKFKIEIEIEKIIDAVKTAFPETFPQLNQLKPGLASAIEAQTQQQLAVYQKVSETCHAAENNQALIRKNITDIEAGLKTVSAALDSTHQQLMSMIASTPEMLDRYSLKQNHSS